MRALAVDAAIVPVPVLSAAPRAHPRHSPETGHHSHFALVYGVERAKQQHQGQHHAQGVLDGLENVANDNIASIIEKLHCIASLG